MSPDPSPVSSFEKLNLRVLVTDDHQFVQHFIIQILNSIGVRDIVTAEDGAQAIKIMSEGSSERNSSLSKRLLLERPDIAEDLQVQRNAFDCIISDFNMLPMNGLQFLKAVRTGEAGVAREIPFIMLTGRSDEGIIATSLDLDVNAYVVKPVSRNDLVKKFARVLKMSVPLKAVADYEAVEVPETRGDDMPKAALKGPIIKKTVKDEMDEIESQLKKRDQPGAVPIPVEDLWVGAVIAIDVKGPNGNVLIKAGTQITEHLLHKIAQLVSQDDLEGSVWVRKK
jgi:CheY-like chemotaxis protein